MHIVDCCFLCIVYVNDILVSDFKDFNILILIVLLVIHVNCYCISWNMLHTQNKPWPP